MRTPTTRNPRAFMPAVSSSATCRNGRATGGPRAHSAITSKARGSSLSPASILRRLVRILREGGAQRGSVMAGEGIDAGEALCAARAFAGLEGADLAREVTTPHPYAWEEGSLKLEGPEGRSAPAVQGGFCSRSDQERCDHPHHQHRGGPTGHPGLGHDTHLGPGAPGRLYHDHGRGHGDPGGHSRARAGSGKPTPRPSRGARR